jgi:hypothetical protein
MNEIELMERNHEELQYLDNVLEDVGTSKATRGGLLKKAAFAAAGIGVFGQASSAFAASSGDSAATITTNAITAEALAVTVLTAAVKASPGTKSAPFIPVLKAANQAEYDHYTTLAGLGAKPVTTKFWIPNAALGPSNINLFATLEVAETLFINAYLIAITAFAKGKKDSLARYAGEILGVEAEHRALARYANNVVHGHAALTHANVPNNKGFETYTLKSTNDVVAALEKAGFGFGKQGATPGQFVDFPGNPSKNGTGFYEIAPRPA